MTPRVLLLVPVLLALAPACKLGRDEVLFVTKTGFAVDFDAEPPAWDVGYIREEFTLAPQFEDGQVLPVLTTVGAGAGASALAVDQSFATGDAAMVLSAAYTSSGTYELGEPGDPERVPRPRMDGRVVLRSGDTTRVPFVFGTDTSIGAHVEWGVSGAPSAISIGYKRKELAIVPLREQILWLHVPSSWLFRTEELDDLADKGKTIDAAGQAVDADPAANHPDIATLKADERLVAVPTYRLTSLIAISGADFGAASPEDAALVVSSAYATGPAATLLATHPGIRRVLGPLVTPGGYAAFADDLFSEGGFDGLRFLANVYDAIKVAAGEDRPGALRVQNELDELARERDTYELLYFDWDPAGSPPALVAQELDVLDGAPISSAGFRDWVSLLADYRQSRKAVQAALDSRAPAVSVTHPSREFTAPLDLSDTGGADFAAVRAMLDQIDEEIEALRDQYRDEAVLVDAYDYFLELLQD